jgi:thiosulfate/3-mercaptopyruvate sulfurtransferase
MDLPLVIDAVELSKVLDSEDLIIIDLSSYENYQAGHIPGAIHLDASRLLCGQTPVPNKIPNERQLSELLSDCGIKEQSHVVVYDDQKGPLAGRFIWTLHCCGFNKASFLNGHLEAWKLAGFHSEQTVNTATPSALCVKIERSELIAQPAEILKGIQEKSLTIWDARTKAEYLGEKIVNADHGGHLPGALWLEWTNALAHDAPALLLSPKAIQELMQQAGLNLDRPIVTHCQTHRRSGLTYIAGLYAGADMRCYDGSWFEWGNRADLPYETGTA